MKDLYIVGAGDFGREVAWLAERINTMENEWNLKGFIDDNTAIHGEKRDGYFVLGSCDYFLNLPDDAWVVCAVAAARTKKKIIKRLKTYSNVKFATLIDPSVLYSKRISIGEGCIICAGNILTVDITIGNHVIINLNCTLGHNAVIQDYTTIYPGVNLSGNVTVEECVEMGTGMQIIQGKTIGQQSIVGAGAVVVRDIPEKCVAVGNPAKPIKFFE